MKFETLMLRGLFLACVTVCALVMGAMLQITPASMQLANGQNVSPAVLASQIACPLPADGVICPRVQG